MLIGVEALAVIRFWYTLFSLAAGVAAVSLVLVQAHERQRRLALSFAGFLFSLWLITLSFALADYTLVLSRTGSGGESLYFGSLHLPAVFSLLSNTIGAAGSILYIFVAPHFYHSLLGVPVRRVYKIAYRLLYGTMLVFLGLLLIPSLRETAAVLLNTILFTLVFYGIVLIAFGYKRITEASLRKAIQVFILLAAVFFLPMFLEARIQSVEGSRLIGTLQHFALPSFFGILSLLSLPFTARRLRRPAFFAEDGPTEFFKREYGLSEREGEVVKKLCNGLSNRQIAEALFISPKTVENHLSNIFSKTDVSSRLQLLTLLLSNS